MKKFILFVILLLIFIPFYLSYNHIGVTTYYHDVDMNYVILSDLHDHTDIKYRTKIINELNNLDIDCIFVVGDMINDYSTNHDNLLLLMEDLSQIAPVYYSLGNHEYDYKNVSQIIYDLQQLNITVLTEQYIDTTINNIDVRIGGTYEYAFENTEGRSDLNKYKAYPFLKDYCDTDRYKIMLAHRPDSFIFGKAKEYWHIDEVLSGHTHGGQIILPILGGIYGGDQGYFPKYDYGYFKESTMNIIISRGLGAHKDQFPRWNNIPEIVYMKYK